MSRLTVKEYATYNKLSVQAVYKAIKSGNLVSEIHNGTKYIIIEDERDFEKEFNDIKIENQFLKKENEYLKKMISFLEDERKIFTHLLEKPKKVKKEFKEIKPKKKKKKTK